jgi:signal transduction histidine kinase
MISLLSRRLHRGILAGSLVLLQALSADAAPAVRHVLLLQSLDRGSLVFDRITANFRATLQERASQPVTVTEFVVAPAGFTETPEKPIIHFLQSVFADRPKPDLIVTVGGPATAFARKHRQDLFPQTPVLFAATEVRFLKDDVLDENETSLTVSIDYKGLIEDILQLLPGTQNVFMVTGTGPLSTFWRAELERNFDSFRNRLTFVWSHDLSYEQVLHRAASLPPHSAIFYISSGTFATGGWQTEERTLADFSARANAPVFGAQSVWLGAGIVGGRLLYIENLGAAVADVAARILNGESPESIRIPPLSQGPASFDARQLRRWNIPESRLPPGSDVRFRDASVWGRFKWIIVAAASGLVAQSLLIGALVVSRVRRRRAERTLLDTLTDLRAARAILANLNHRLIQAQEHERARLGRELHDDIGQRMAFLMMEIEQLGAMLPERPDAQSVSQALYDRVSTLGADIQGISHRLHSSKLEYLGLARAANSLCKELSRQHGIAIDFVHESVPADLPADIALNLFRVLQEALSNAIKYSNARHYGVTLQGTPGEVSLEVVDDGCGFDVEAALRGPGLGLVSMRERLSMVNGEATIESRVGRGTRVRVRAPIHQTVAV